MDDLQGGLNQVSAPAPAPVAQPQIEQPAIKEPVANLQDKALSEVEATRAALNAQMKKMIDSANTRSTNNLFDPKLMALATGLLAPTKTGGFGESLGAGFGKMAEAATAEEKERQENAKMRLEMMSTGLSLQEKQLAQDLMGKLYKVDAKGNPTTEVDPAVAAKLAKLTGDPKYQQMVVADLQLKQSREAFNTVFPTSQIRNADGTTKTVVTYNPEGLSKVVNSSVKPAETLKELTGTLKEMRQNGMLGDNSTRDTPFDTISLFAKTDPAIQAQARYYAERYKAGMINDEDADKYAKSLMDAYEKSLTREDQNLFKRMMLGLRQDALDTQTELKREALRGKLSDQEKMDYRQVIIPVINEGTKAGNALNTLDQLKNIISNAPSGAISGYYNKSIGAWLGTDKNTALRDLEAKSKLLMTQIPRLPGSQSNFDAANLEKSLGQLADPKLTNDQRLKLLGDVEAGFKSLQDRSWAAQDYWEENHKIAPELTGRQSSDKSAEPTEKSKAAPVDIATQAKATFGSYDPAHWNYRIAPDGVVERKKK